MRYKHILTGMSVFLGISILINVVLLQVVWSANKQVNINTNRIKYLEDNIDTLVEDAMKVGGHVESILEDVNWTISDLVDEEEKTALLHIEFKLRTMDPSASVYASIESGDREAVLMEAHLLNDTTYSVDREVNVLEPIRIDLMVEKYGEKRIENLVNEPELYKTYIADTSFNLLDFNSSYNSEREELNLSFSTELMSSAKKDWELVRSEYILEKNGVIMERGDLSKSTTEIPDAIVYEGSVGSLSVKATKLDQIRLAVVMKDKLGFTYRYDFAEFSHKDGEPVVTTISMPELTLH
ncbi:hypothetical protein [Proteiniclasticum ruminis]|uniref:Uncharacterized protein n=1 Tax=Proteiniclasticum ruminis TaxID=398199 RepID=A0A1G8H388_9CLOT|nr:hypothetical protein [Proteiniclasticum ruminis]SDI01029.1 hypothetical protein SAMN05421804_101456 [Proteiniclasticum ruminis]